MSASNPTAVPTSRYSRHRPTSRVFDTSSSPPSDPEQWQQHIDSKLNGLDADRFTPTLHASLVSEILGLRRELDAKNGLVENVETDLQSTKAENEALNSRLSEAVKESRQEKKRADQIEHDTYAAVEDLLHERDEAVHGNADLRIRLDATTKKARNHEAELSAARQRWEEERRVWDNERRQFERRIHVTDTRMRTLVEGMSAAATTTSTTSEVPEKQAVVDEESQHDEIFQDSGLGNDSDVVSLRSINSNAHRRTHSSQSLRSTRATSASPSKQSIPHQQPAGLSLADELDFEDDDDDLDADYMTPQDEQQAPLHASSHLSNGQKNLDESDPNDKDLSGTIVNGTDVAPILPDHAAPDIHRPYLAHASREPQRHPVFLAKNDPVEPKSLIQSPDRSNGRPTSAYVHRGTQPELPNSPDNLASVANTATPIAVDQVPRYSSTSTQTDPPSTSDSSTSTETSRSTTPESAAVPFIAIHPPRTAPSSPRAARLPPGTRSFGCQADLPLRRPMVNASMQTERIRVDMRSIKLSAHLRSLPIAADASAPAPTTSKYPPVNSVDPAADSGMQQHDSGMDLGSFARKPVDTSQAVPAVPAERQSQSRNAPISKFRRDLPQTATSQRLLADMGRGHGPDSTLSEANETDIESQDIFGATPALSLNKSALRALEKDNIEALPAVSKLSSPTAASFSTGTSAQRQNLDHVPLRTTSKDFTSKTSSRGTASQGRPPLFRPRTSSAGTAESSIFSSQSQPPPFQVPTRYSSRVPDSSFDEEPPSPSPQETSRPSPRLQMAASQQSNPTGLRKVQSANVVGHRFGSSRRTGNEPSLPPFQSTDRDGGSASPLETLPVRRVETPAITNISGPATDTARSAIAAAHDKGDPPQDTALIDAIASAMVGEWMYKYVQRKKNFGLGDSGKDFADDGSAKSNVVRHKRWVWLSPYDRTIMWSAKQPLTSAALFGKSGRKLSIKSTIDVPDNNPPPKGVASGEVFSRSIVILAPDRALKITTCSRERHYLWLLALSFLANPSQGPPQVPRLPALMRQERVDEEPRGREKSLLRRSLHRVKSRNFTAPVQSKDRYVSEPMPESDAVQSEFRQSPEDLDTPEPPRQPPTRQRSKSGSQMATPMINLRSFGSSNALNLNFKNGRERTSSPFRKRMPRSPWELSRNLNGEQKTDFFEAAETMRLDAFVDTPGHDDVLYVPHRPEAISRARRGRGDSALTDGGSRTEVKGGYVIDRDGRDPFRGF